MEDIFGVSGGYAPYLGTGPGTINAPFEMDNDYDSVPSTSRDSAATNGIDRRGSLQNNRQSPTGKCIRVDLASKSTQCRNFRIFRFYVKSVLAILEVLKSNFCKFGTF